MRRKRSTSCRKTTESCSPTSFPALACWDVWPLTTVSPCSQGYIHIEFVLSWSHWRLCVILAVGDQKLCWCFPCWHRSCDLILQPAGGPGDTAARSTPEDPAAPHGLVWPWISWPQSSGRPLWGHPLADTGVRSGAGHKSLFVSYFYKRDTLGFPGLEHKSLDSADTQAVHFKEVIVWPLMFPLHFIVSDCTPVCILRILLLISSFFTHKLDVTFITPKSEVFFLSIWMKMTNYTHTHIQEQ